MSSLARAGRWVTAGVLVGLLACSGDGDGAAGQGGDTGQGGLGASSVSASGAGAGTVGPPRECGAEEQRSGEATYYDFADGSGNCSFDPSPEDLRVGAMNHEDYAASAACGACAAIEGPNGAVTVRIVDQCPECPAGDIDLSPEAFAEIADLSLGRVPITWQYAPCEVSGPIRYHFKEGSNPYWLAVQVRNHRYAIATVEYADAAGGFTAMAREDYNFFVEPAGLGEGPFAFRVTDVYGQTLEDTGIPLVEAGDSAGASQFGPCE
jgi:expansin